MSNFLKLNTVIIILRVRVNSLQNAMKTPVPPLLHLVSGNYRVTIRRTICPIKERCTKN